MEASYPSVLDAAARDLTWVRVAGYALEKIHTGVLVHALGRDGPPSHALAAALWQRVSGETIDPSAITAVRATTEVALDAGVDSVIDLLVAITTSEGVRWLGVEMKVDASPRREQLERLGRGVRARQGVAHCMALLALGAAQVCRVERGIPAGIVRLSIDDLLALSDGILAAGEPTIVGPWLRELSFERARRDHADAVPADAARRLGYRARTLRAYQLALLSRRVEDADGKPWEVSVQSHNVIATSASSWRRIPGDGPPTMVYLELTNDGLCLKAGCWEGRGDPRAESAAITTRAFEAFRAAGLHPERPRQAQGKSATLCKMTRAEGSEPVAWLRDATAAWARVWDQYVAASAGGATPAQVVTVYGPPTQALPADGISLNG